jgi:DNA-3-methyladenine glycosylase II
VELMTLWTGGRRKLGADPDFGPWVAHVGPVRVPRSTEDPFFYLARAIIYQQLATPAAKTIHGRFVEALGGDVSASKVLRVRESTLRKAGLSAAKTVAVCDLATKVRSGDVALDDLEEMGDEEALRHLVRVKGIGPWTAQMYLMFRLRRPDVWPVLDLGVRTGFAKIRGLATTLPPKELEPLGERYRPWRSVAAFYCWRALEHELEEPIGDGLVPVRKR